jgi:hypothetical protein
VPRDASAVAVSTAANLANTRLGQSTRSSLLVVLLAEARDPHLGATVWVGTRTELRLRPLPEISADDRSRGCGDFGYRVSVGRVYDDVANAPRGSSPTRPMPEELTNRAQRIATRISIEHPARVARPW